MGKFRARTKTGKNRQRWKKGQSSSSNPTKSKHRDAAKSRLLRVGFGVPELPKSFENGPTRLTAETLLKHDALMGNATAPSENPEEIDAITLGQTNKTFDTFASSVWSNCSNVSFGRLLPRFSPSNPKHREMLAILSAVTDVIKETRMEESDEEPTGVEFFWALLKTLDLSDQLESISATVALISIVIKTVEKDIFKAKFSDAAKAFLKLLEQHKDSDDASVVRGLLGCLCVLLRAQDAETWNFSSTTKVMDSILSFAIDSRPKVRKASHHAVCSILASKEEGTDFHPAANKASEFLVKLIEDNVGQNEKAVLHVLILLKEILHTFPKQNVKKACESILRIMSVGNRMSLSCGFQALHGLFSGRPSVKSLPGEMNAKLINAMYDYQPAMDDPQPSVAWLTVMQEAHINLAEQDFLLCLENLAKFFQKASRYWVLGGDVAVAATAAMKAILNESVRAHLETLPKNSVHICETFREIEKGLKYEFHQSWAQVLNLLMTFFDVCGSNYSHIVGNCLKAMADLRSSANFAFTNELDYVIGKAVRTIGPQEVLQHIPLQINGREESLDFPRSWLLPVLRENVRNANLSFFKSYFLPIAYECNKRVMELKEDEKIAKKAYEMIVRQIWSLLPGFCNNPPDLSSCFGDIGKDLFDNLRDPNRKDLRMYIMASLRQLLLKSTENESNRETLSKRAILFLKTLLDLYIKKPEGAEEAGQRMSMMETLKLFLPLAKENDRTTLFDKVLEKYNEKEAESIDKKKSNAELELAIFIKDACHDLLRVMLNYQDEECIQRIYNMCTQDLDKDHKRQKKAYKLLEEICSSSPGSNCHNFLRGHLEDIKRHILESLSKASPPSQASRLRCLINILRNLDDNNQDFAFRVVPEAVLCIKATNEKARSSSFTLLVVIGEALLRWQNNDETEKVLKDYMKVILAGLAGGTTMIHCTVLAIARLYYEFHDLFPNDLLEMLIENVCLLITSKSREVVNACISFLHGFITTCPVMESARFCEKIVSALCRMTDDCKNHCRQKTRNLFNRLVRKFGYDLIKALIPKDDTITLKRLSNIRKAQAKKDKIRGEADEESDDEDNDDDFRIKAKPKTMEDILAASEAQDSDNDDMEVDDKKRVVRRKKKSATYIAEDNNGEAIVDFLDASAAQKVRNSKPKSKLQEQATKKKQEEFEIAPDGRLIIRDSEDEEDPKAGRFDMDDSDEENQETFASLVSGRKRKRGTSIASSKKSEPAMKYQAGGTGIHRPLDANSKKAVKEYGSEYRSKKARGDMKVKGKPDPFAYVPLHKSSLNRRKKAKFEGQFKGLVKAANKGSQSGKKAKGLTKRMKNVKI